MKKVKLLLLLFFTASFGFSQVPCLPATDGVPGQDELPGCVLCDSVYVGSTAGFSADTFAYDFPCGTVENSQWLSVFADSLGAISLGVFAENCSLSEGVQLALYDENLNLVGDCAVSDAGSNLPPTVFADGLTPGNIYHIMVGGKNGDECDFRLLQRGGIRNFSQSIPARITAEPEAARYCIGAQVCFSIAPIPGASEYVWEAPFNVDTIRGGGLRDTFICIEFLANGGGVLGVTPNFVCGGTGIKSITAAVAIPIIQTTVFTTVCADDLPIRIDQQMFDDFGTFPRVLLSRLGCDSPVTYTVFEFEVVPEPLDTLICAGTCVQLEDSCYFVSTDTPIDLHCRVISELNISTIDSFPPPIINCSLNTGNLIFEWNEVVGAEAYFITINGDSMGILTRTNFPIQGIPFDSSFTIVVQPIASNKCKFLPGILTCPESNSVVEKALEASVNIFPNPTTGTIEIQSESEIETIRIFDFSGKEVLNLGTSKTDLSKLGSGIYFFKIQTKEGTILKKVFKQ